MMNRWWIFQVASEESNSGKIFVEFWLIGLKFAVISLDLAKAPKYFFAQFSWWNEFAGKWVLGNVWKGRGAFDVLGNN